MKSLINYFETYRGHDQSLGLIGYGSLMLSGASKTNNKYSRIFKKLSSEISNARAVLRLLDDTSMLGYTISYGLGRHEKVFLKRMLTIISNIASHVYYVSEHVGWAADKNILTNINSGIYHLTSLLCWLISLFCSIVCNLVTLKQMINSSQRNKNEHEFSWLNKTCVKIYLKLLEDLFFTMNAIHWLPSGQFLWSGRLSDFSVGLFGVLSLLCNLISNRI
jgi:peroxin-11C